MDTKLLQEQFIHRICQFSDVALLQSFLTTYIKNDPLNISIQKSIITVFTVYNALTQLPATAALLKQNR